MMPALTIKDMILLHLSKYRGYRNRVVVPEAITQEGIAKVAGVKRTHISVELKRMREEKGWIEEKKAHAGPGNKKKVYFITPGGEERLSKILSDIERKTAVLEIDGIEHRVRAEQAVEVLLMQTDMSYPEAVKEVLNKKKVSLSEIRRRKHKPYSTPIPQVKQIFGREGEYRRIKAWYGKKTPVMCLLGVGGIGKSSLASYFAGQVQDPVFWHSVREWQTGAGLISEMAEFFRKNGEDPVSSKLLSETEEDRALDALSYSSMRYLIVLDDYHEAPQEIKRIVSRLKEVLSESKGKMLILSRAIPRFYSRKDILVDKTVEELFLRGISEQGAQELLKATGAYPRDENFRKIYAVSAGHPMMLKLAAASPESAKSQVMDYLTEEFYKKTGIGERKVLARLSVFRRPVPAEAFLRDESEASALNTLLEKGFVHHDQKGGYFTHDIIKELFTDKQDLNEEHGLAAEYYSETKGGEIERIYHLLMAGKTEKAEEELRNSVEYMLSSGRANELLEALEVSPETPVFLSSKGRALSTTKSIGEAVEMVERAVREANTVEKPYALMQLGSVYRMAGKYSEAEKVLRESMRLAQSESERKQAETSLSETLFFMGRYKESEKIARSVSEHFRKTGDEYKEHQAISIIAMALARQGRYDEAIPLLKECADAYERNGNYRNLGNTYNQMAMYEAYLDKREEARRHFEMAALYGDIAGYRMLVAYALMNSADNHIYLGDPEKAIAYSRRAEEMLREMGNGTDAAVALSTLAKAQMSMGNRKEAESTYSEATERLKETEDFRILAEIYCEWAEMETDPSRRKKIYENALGIYHKIGDEEREKEIKSLLDGL